MSRTLCISSEQAILVIVVVACRANLCSIIIPRQVEAMHGHQSSVRPPPSPPPFICDILPTLNAILVKYQRDKNELFGAIALTTFFDRPRQASDTFFAVQFGSRFCLVGCSNFRLPNSMLLYDSFLDKSFRKNFIIDEKPKIPSRYSFTICLLIIRMLLLQ